MLLNFNNLFIEHMFRAYFVCICDAYVIFDVIDGPVLKFFTVAFFFKIKLSLHMLHMCMRIYFMT